MLKLAHRLFWDVDPTTLDRERHADFIMERMLEYGTWEGIQWLRITYGDERIRDYLLRRGHRVLSNKTLNFWKIMLDLGGEECLQTSSLRSSRVFWNY